MSRSFSERWDGMSLWIVLLLVVTVHGNHQWWLRLAQKQGPMVCIQEKVSESERYFSTPWTGGNICGSETIVRFSCCPGFQRMPGERGCPLVSPLKNLADTARLMGANQFMDHADQSGLTPLLTNRGAFTVFAAQDSAFSRLSQEHEKMLNGSRQSRSRPPVLLFTVAEGRLPVSDLPNTLATLYRQGSLIVTKFPNGLVTANCVPLISTDVVATNGLLHMTESLLLPNGQSTITDMLVRAAALSTMATAIVRAQLSSRLKDKDVLTIFAPVDAAWESLPQSFMEALMEDVNSLKVLLEHHMMESVWCSAAAGGETKLTTLEGSKVRLWCNESGQYIENARILEGDHAATNGFIHHIDTVLIPDRVRSLAELLESRDMTFFLQLTEAAGLQSILQRNGAYTMFVPSDQAFEELSNETRATLMARTNLARSVVSFHITSGRQLTPNFIDGQTLTTLRGQQPALRIAVQRKSVTVESALITSPNVEARNGIMHVVDRVIIPPTLTVSEILQDNENFNSFVEFLNETDPNLLNSLSNVSTTYTVFAPSNEAMNQTPPGMINRLKADPSMFYQMAAHHIVEAFVVTKSLEFGLTYQHTDKNDKPLTLRRESEDSVTVARMATIEDADIMATNGVVHQISRFIFFS